MSIDLTFRQLEKAAGWRCFASLAAAACYCDAYDCAAIAIAAFFSEAP
ncbi:hypothetical protein HUU39_09375 [candidate division KSB1 bacterium]|nr:hypothetical protein [bacterium]NUM65476.1 hypothetical protein [candidate division KSB1 bacterium]